MTTRANATAFDVKGAKAEIAAIVGPANVTGERHICLTYARGRGIFTRGRTPDLVVRPRRVEEVQELMRYANRVRAPVYVRGAASRPFGYYPVHGGILVDMTRFNRLLDINEASLTSTVEPGITFGELDAALYRRGFHFLVSPMGSLGGTVGGNVVCHAVSSRCFLVENQAECVTGLRVVMPTGELLTTGAMVNPAAHSHFMRYSFMHDLTGLILGSEGTLGIIVEIGLKIEEIPPAVAHVMYGFDDIKDVVRAIYLTRRKRVPALDVIVRYLSAGDMERTMLAPPPRIAAGWMHVGGGPAAVSEAVETISGICEGLRGRRIPDAYAAHHWVNRWHPAMTPQESERAVREYEALSFSQVCPLGEAPEYLDLINANSEQLRLEFPDVRIFDAMVIHPAGRGLLVHSSVLYPEDDPVASERAWAAFQRMKQINYELGVVPYNAAVAYFGDRMPETGEYYLALKKIKALFDPQGIMSPGVGNLP